MEASTRDKPRLVIQEHQDLKHSINLARKMLELRKQEDPKIRSKSKYKTLVKIFTDLNSMNNKRYKYNNNYRINFTARIFKI